MPRLAPVPVIVILAAALALPSRAAAETDYFTFLRAGGHHPGVGGDSEYERDLTHRELEVTVTGATRLAGHRIAVYVDGHKVGRIHVSSLGRGHRKWSTEHHQGVPNVRAGSRVRVRTAHGTLIASGKYRRERDSD